jgi:uncharacterized membrane protein YkvA (DUF1232 family)
MFRFVFLAVLVTVIYFWWSHPQRFRPTVWRRWVVPAVVAFGALLYAASPVDLVPDAPPIGFVDDLIVLISAFWWIRQRLEKIPIGEEEPRQRRPAAGEKRQAWDPYAVLGIRRGASREEVAHAYREQMKLYHPDRVAELGEDLQRVAHEKSIEIQRAYQEVTRGS